MTANVNVTKVLFKRGNTVQNAAYTGINGEITVDTQAKTLRIHDGVTTGGNVIVAGGVVGSYSNTNAAAYIPTDSTITAIQSNVTAANAAIIVLQSNASTQQTQINLLNANVTAANALIPNLSAVSGNILPSANVTYSLGSSTRQWRDLWVSNNTIYIGNVPITVSNGNLLVNGNLVTGSGGSGTDDVLRANVGAYQTFANANAATQATSINTFNANLGAYQTFANANAATQATSINTFNANLGAYQTFANSNAATQATSINTFNANLGAYQTFANSNAATQSTAIATLQTQVYANANVNTYLSSSVIGSLSTSGNLTVGGNLVVNGNSTIINTTSYTIEDNILQIADGNPADTLDLGFVGHRTVAGNLQHTGLVRDASAGNWRLFSNVTAQPGNTVDFTNAIYDDLVVGNISANIVKNGNVWTFGTDGTTRFPTNISIDYSGGNVLYPRIIAGSGTTFSVQGQGNIGSAALAWTADPNAASQYASVGVARVGDNLAKVVLLAMSDSADVATAKIWQFNETGTTQFPNGLILAPVSQSITMQSDQYSQLMWENSNLTVAPNMAINSNFYVAQNNATLDIGYRDGSGTQVIKSWYWNADGIMTLPTAGRINFDNLSISSDANVSAFYAPAGNVQLAAGIGDAQIVASSLSDSKIWNFGANANLTLPQTGYLQVGQGIVAGFLSSPAPIITGFSNISAQNFTFLANGVNILSTVGAGAYGNTQVAAYLPTYSGNVSATNYLFANGVNILSTVGASSYGNTQVAAYLMTWPNAGINILDTTSANITTLRAANFNSANTVISGGYISALTNASIITSTVVTQNITNGNITTLRATNFGTANAVISGGYISALTNASIITSTVVTENITNGNVTTLVATNFSTANAVISGGYIANTANITVTSGGNIAGVGNIIGSTANTTITAGAFTTSFLSNGVMITSNIIQTDAYYETYSNVTNTGGNITFNFANTTVFYATLTANVTANITNLANNLSTVTGFTVIIDQGATPYRIANIQFDGGAVTNIRWAGTTVPTGTASNTDIVSISLINLGNGSYRVLGQQSSYG